MEIAYTNLAERVFVSENAANNNFKVVQDMVDPAWVAGQAEPFGILILEPMTAEEIALRQLRQEINSFYDAARLALQNWGTLTAGQKDTILRGLLKLVLWKEKKLNA